MAKQSKKMAKKKANEIFTEITAAVGRSDWNAVLSLSQQILALDPNNSTADLYKKLARDQIGSLRIKAEAPAESLPKAFVDGRYQVKRFLGEGIYGRKST